MLIVHLLIVQLPSAHGVELRWPAGSNPISVVRPDLAPLATLVTARGGSTPLAAGRDAGSGYLCQHGACQSPATTPEQLRAQLAPLTSLWRQAASA